MSRQRSVFHLRFGLVAWVLCAAASCLLAGSASADIRLPAIVGDHMVLQQGQPNRIWGWADAGEKVTVRIAGQTSSATAGSDGKWTVKVPPLPAGGPHELMIEGKNSLKLQDVLVGEVWICSGQSNMQWSVAASKDADLEIPAANFPRIHLISVPQVGTQKPQDDFKGRWEPCTPDSVRGFSAVGYFFGRQLHTTLDVPIGLINDAWGGSACEAWIRRDLLAADPRYKPLLDRWAEIEEKFDTPGAAVEYDKQVAAWKEESRKAKEAGKKAPPQPPDPRGQLAGNHRPGNIYCGVLHPTIGYGIRGAIWYQGESNAGRAYQYRDLFPLMIKSWRDEWGQGDFPFYWVQLADYMQETPEPAESSWAELREAQTMTMSRLPNTGQAVIIDVGEADDIHPKNKQDVGTRLARWALARQYNRDVAYASPVYKSMEKQGKKIVITMDVGEHASGALDAFDVPTVKGFAIAGADRKFVWAEAKIVGRDRVEVSSPQVADPVAVRYAWADNPVCNLKNRAGLPASPFRTDDWPGKTVDAVK